MNTTQALSVYPRAFLQHIIDNDLGVDFKGGLNLQAVTSRGLALNTSQGTRIIPLHSIFINTYNVFNPAYTFEDITMFLRAVLANVTISDLRLPALRYFMAMSDETISLICNPRLAELLLHNKREGVPSDPEGPPLPIPSQLLLFIEGFYSRNSILGATRKLSIIASRIDVLNAILSGSIVELTLSSRVDFTGSVLDFIPLDRLNTTGESQVQSSLEDTVTDMLHQRPRIEIQEPVKLHSLLAEGYTESKLNQKLQGCYVLFKGEPVFIQEVRDSDIIITKVNGSRIPESAREVFSEDFDITQPILGFINTDVGVYFIERRHVDNTGSKYKIAFCPNKVRRYSIHPVPSVNGLRKVFKDKVIQHMDISEFYFVSKLLVKSYYTIPEAIESLILGKRLASAISEDLALVASYETNSIYVWLGTKVVGYYDGGDLKLHIKARNIRQFFTDFEGETVYE